ncbi:VWA domain-containing protein [Candidatus Babeliales bacterium]|nr:VWA domain-containing protein [Candidatus Babeliales bacterium]
MVFQFAQPMWLIIGVLFIIGVTIYRYVWYKPTLYVFPLLHFIKKHTLQSSLLPAQFFFWIRLASLILMAILLGKPQFIDSKSKVDMQGIDIVLALDMSGSMNLYDDLNDQRNRLQVAKQEALNFVDQRKNDSIGLVLFGRYSLVRCPLTTDKTILKSLISDLRLGLPSEDMSQATMLSQGLLTAVRRLQNSQAKSKVVILLTDGIPSPGDLNALDVVKIAQELGVKVYTIGIGDVQGGYAYDPLFGWIPENTPVNEELLHAIAQATGGKSFQARKPKDLKQIYEIIDSLEKQTYQTQVYAKYYDYFMPLLWILLCFLIIEICVGTWIWFIV